MAQTLQIKMSRQENSPWGFRLHGGVDFGTPLTIQKVGKMTKISVYLNIMQKRPEKNTFILRNQSFLHPINQ